jgi:hypothetical protein
MIRSGRNGLVKYDPTGAGGPTAVALMSIKTWTASFATEKINVTCFQDTNRVFLPGMRSADGTLSGFWNSEDLTLVEATQATTPGYLELIPDTTDLNTGVPPAPYTFSGLAWLDMEINTDVEGAPALTGTWSAAGSWTMASETGVIGAGAPPPEAAAPKAA